MHLRCNCMCPVFAVAQPPPSTVCFYAPRTGDRDLWPQMQVHTDCQYVSGEGYGRGAGPLQPKAGRFMPFKPNRPQHCILPKALASPALHCPTLLNVPLLAVDGRWEVEEVFELSRGVEEVGWVGGHDCTVREVVCPNGLSRACIRLLLRRQPKNCHMMLRSPRTPLLLAQICVK